MDGASLSQECRNIGVNLRNLWTISEGGESLCADYGVSRSPASVAISRMGAIVVDVQTICYHFRSSRT